MIDERAALVARMRTITRALSSGSIPEASAESLRRERDTIQERLNEIAGEIHDYEERRMYAMCDP